MSPLLPAPATEIGFDVALTDGPTPDRGDVFDLALDREAIRVDAFGLQRRRYEATLRDLARQVFGEDSEVFGETEREGRRRSAEARAQIGRDQAALQGGTRAERGKPPRATKDRGPRSYSTEELEKRVFGRIGDLNAAGVGNFANLPKSADELRAQIRQDLGDEFRDAEAALGRREEGTLGFLTELAGSAVGGFSETDVALSLAGGRRGFAAGVTFDAGLGVLGEALTLPRQYRVAGELDIETPDPLVQLGTAGLFAGGLSAGLRTLGAGYGAIRGDKTTDEMVREARERGSDLSPAGRGALDRVEADRITAETRPDGADPADFEADTARADDAIRLDDPGQLPEGRTEPEAVKPKSVAPRKTSGVTDRIIRYGTAGPKAEIEYRLRPTRRLPLSEPYLDTVSSVVGGIDPTLKIVITSAGQVPLGTKGPRTGSVRHDVDHTGVGNTADFKLVRDGKVIRPTDDPELFVRVIEDLAARFPGIGHYDDFLHVGIGSEMFWGPSRRGPGHPDYNGDPRFHAAWHRGRAAAKAAGSTTSRIIAVESGGRLHARNPNSSAFGPGQFLSDTWLELVGKYRPDLAEGRSQAEILALRSDRDLATEMVERYAQANRAFLADQGLPFHDGALYLAHFAGPTGAARILSADPATPIGKLMSREAIEANAGIRYGAKRFSEFTAGDLTGWARYKMGLASGNVTELPTPTGVMDFDPLGLRTDADAFQYKRSDAEGVTARLLAEDVWSPEAGIGVMVFERADGMQFIADGHQRLALARRLAESGQTDIRLQGYLYREVDGWTPDVMRVYAALKNIRQETGTPADAAKVLRDHPELRGELNASRGFLQQAHGLAKLAPNAFDAVVNDVIPEHYAAIIGTTMPGDDQLQMAAIALMRRHPPENATQAQIVARDVRRLGLEERASGAQGDLFGDMDLPGETLVMDRARVMERALRELKSDRKLFARLNAEADRIEEAGNVVRMEANEARRSTVERAIETALRLADEPGPVRDALDRAARTYREGGRRKAVAGFLGDLRAAAEGDFGGGSGRGDADAGLAHPDFDATAGAARTIEDELTAAAEAPAPVRAEDWGDPVDGPGPRAEAEVLEADIRRVLDGEEPEAQGFLDFEIAEGVTARDLLDDLEQDAEFADQVAICQPKGA